MAYSIETELECSTLEEWADQLPIIEVAEIYDQLRESLTAAQLHYDVARVVGDDAAASRAVGEMADLTALLDVVVEGLEWRRHLMLNFGRAWVLDPMYRIGL